jgi:hypothetical protein
MERKKTKLNLNYVRRTKGLAHSVFVSADSKGFAGTFLVGAESERVKGKYCGAAGREKVLSDHDKLVGQITNVKGNKQGTTAWLAKRPDCDLTDQGCDFADNWATADLSSE